MLIGERVNAQGSRAVKRMLLAEEYDDIVAVGRGQAEGGAHALDVCVAVTERNDEAEQMRAVVRGLEMSVDAPLIIDSTDAAVIRAALEVIPGSRRRQQRQPRERPHPLRGGAAAGARPRRLRGRADHRRAGHGQHRRPQAGGGDAHPRHRLRRVRAAAAPAALRRAHLHAGHRRGGVHRLRAPDHRRHPAHQGGAARRADRARASPTSRSGCRRRAGRRSTASSSTTACRRGWTPPSSTRRTSPRTRRSAPPSASWPRTSSSTAARTRWRATSSTSTAPSASAVTDSTVDPFAGMDPAQRIHAQILQRRRDGIEEQIDLAVAGARPRRGAQRGAPPGDEGGGRPLRRRRADPAVRAAERRGDEARRRPAREVPRPRRGDVEGHRGARHRVRRRARHRQEPGQHHPQQQRLHRARPRQAGAADHDHRAAPSRPRPTSSGSARCW